MLLIFLSCTWEPGDEARERPFDAFDTWLNGFHYASGDMETQMEVDHHCNTLDSGTIECVLFDADGRLVGTEHVVPRAVFESFDLEEATLWHAHVYEVLSGMLVAPELDADAELELMRDLVSTYGKTWHTTHEGEVLGVPILMKAFYGDDQLDPTLLEARDDRLDVDSDARREARAGIEDPGFDTRTLVEPVIDVCETTPTEE
ncbi:MAG: DUF1264 domain-containing protein [Myxococcota bacterium]